MPDKDLKRLKALPLKSEEWFCEEQRLRKVLLDQGSVSYEKISSFVEYLNTIEDEDPNYWYKIFSRIGLCMPQQKWWMFWKI